MKFLPFLLLLVAPVLLSAAEKKEVPTWTDPKKAAAARPDFLLQGEYVGKQDGKPIGLQAADLDAGQFHVLTYAGGLPGEGWDGAAIKADLMNREQLRSAISGLERIERKSPTLGNKAPEGARVIFNGKKNDQVEGKIEDGFLWAGSKTTQPAKDFTLHAEFRLPYKPSRELSSQDRGNSGVYLFDNYETQVIDTFGLDFNSENNKVPLKSLHTQWCASFYKFKTPDVPMAFPPLQWQTYDIHFTAPRFENGEKVKNARIKVVHNGVIVHDDVEMPKGTGAGGNRPEKPLGIINFQGHGNPVAFRNVWLLEK
ncbi:MAG: DUF1080 domain-containing protein [Verrucomicrobiales bacterium]|nr:DUF1080 domain-containing protein [Verrucomicrobiales bacterium]